MKIKTTTSFEATWAQIKESAENGTLNELLKSGDVIPVTLKNGEEVEFDVCRDEKGKVFLVLHDLLRDEHCMNKDWTNEGGWAASDMRRYVNKEVFALLPDDLQEIIAPTTIVQIIDGERVEVQDKLFCLSATQVFGNCRHSQYEPEDTQLDIFKGGERSRVKNWRGETWYWWLRSADAGGSTSFAYVYANGTASSYGASGRSGVCVGFSV